MENVCFNLCWKLAYDKRFFLLLTPLDTIDLRQQGGVSKIPSAFRTLSAPLRL